MSDEKPKLNVGCELDLRTDGPDITTRAYEAAPIENLRFREDMPPGYVSLCAGGREVIRLEANGDILIHGRLAANDLEVVEGMRELLGLGKKP